MLSSKETGTAPAPVAVAPHKRLGDMLLEEGIITRQQLEDAILHQKTEGGFLGQLLMKLGYVDAEQITSCLVKQCKIPHLNLLDYEISASVLRILPEDLCRKHQLLPIDKLGKILTVAMINPLDMSALEEVRNVCPDLRIKPILCNMDHFSKVIGRIYADNEPAETTTISAQSLGLNNRLSPKQQKDFDSSQASGVAASASDPSGGLDMASLTKVISGAQGGNIEDAMRSALAPLLQETVRQALAQQSAQSAQLAAMTENAMRSVQQATQLVEAASVAENNLRDLHGQNKHASVTPFLEAFAPVPNPGDENVMRAMDSHQPQEMFRFAGFFPGKANAFTFKLGEAVAEKPGQDYNPFFLYGNVGIGKTHLINAIGNDILDRNKKARVGYVSASNFARRLSEAIKQSALAFFRENYCCWEVLILDDIQFLGGRIEAQEEFFHIFNVLYQQGRQIIIAADKAPDRLGLLEQRLVSRFGSGIVAELKAPEYEARMEILRYNAKQTGVTVPDAVLNLIATRVPNDVRRMMGALRKIVAYAQLVGQEISAEMAGEILNHLGIEEAA